MLMSPITGKALVLLTFPILPIPVNWDLTTRLERLDPYT